VALSPWCFHVLGPPAKVSAVLVRLGKYEVIRYIATRRHGVVYLRGATQYSTREVALKGAAS